MTHPTLLGHFLERIERHPDRVAFREGVDGRPWSWREWGEAALALAESLIAGGVEPGDRVAVLAGNRPVWPTACLGITLAGAVIVGIYPTSAPAQVADLLRDSGARWLLADTATRAASVVRAADRDVPGLERVVAWDGGEVDAGVAAWRERVVRRPERAGERAARTAALTGESLAALIYTSGSTGEPRGAMIPHRYLTTSVESIDDVVRWREDDLVLSFLPYNHAAEQVTGLWSRVRYGHGAVLVEDHRRVWDAARGAGITVFAGLPRFFEKLHEAMAAGGDPRAVVAAHLGSRVRLATSGGAALSESVARGLAAGGLEVLGAYGLTEHLCVAFNRPGQARADTAGPPMRGTTIRIAADGEILVARSALTFAGYWGKPEATAAAFTPDGAWLATGDLGAITGEGMLRVVGRKKDLLALSTGKKVAPAPLEARLSASPLVDHALVVGDGRKYLAALLFVRPDVVEREGAALEPALGTLVDRINADLSPPEQIRRWVVVPVELSEARGEVTGTAKARRALLATRYADQVEACYQ